MAAPVASLEVDVGMNLASLYAGAREMTDVIGRAGTQASTALEGLNSRVDAVTGAFKALAGIAAVSFAVHFVKDLVGDALEAQASLADLGLKAGISASQLSALIPAARLSGTSLDDVAAASGKFAKNLVELQNGQGKAVEAFRALGFSAADASRFLKSPADGLREVSLALAKYADDGGKLAAVQQLLGKSGAQLLPFLHDLAAQGELNVRVTDEQAEAAKHLQDQYTLLKLRSEELKQTLVASLVPTFSRLLQQFADAGQGPDGLGAKLRALAEEGSFAIWVQGTLVGLATLVESFVFMGKVLLAFSSSVQVVINDIKVLGAVAAFTNPATAFQNNDIQKMLEKRSTDLENANKRWSSLWDDNHTSVSDSLKKTLADMDAFRSAFRETLEAQAKAAADFPQNMDQNDRLNASLARAAQGKPSLGDAHLGAKVPTDEFTKALQELGKQADAADAQLEALFSGDKLTDAEKYLNTLRNSDAWAKLNAGQRATVEGIVEFVAASQAQSEAATNAKASAAAYAAALVELSKAAGEGAASIQRAQLDAQAADAKRSYDQGLINARQYYDQLDSITLAGFATQTAQLEEQAREQQAVVDSARTAYVDFVESSAHQKLPIAEQLAEAAKAAAPLIAAMAKLGITQDKLTETQVKATQVGKNYYQSLIEQSDGILQGVRASEKAVERAERENEEMGLTRSQIALLTQARIQDIIAKERASGKASDDDIAALEREAAAAGKLSEVLAKGEGTQRLIDGFRELESTTKGIFESLFEKGEDTFKKLGQSLKKWLIDLLYQLTVRPLLINIGAQITGVSGSVLGGATNPGGLLGLFSQAAGGAGGAGGGGLGGLGSLGNLFGLGGAAAGGAAYTGAIGASIGASEAVGISGAALGTSLGATGAGLGIAGTVAAAIPVIGWAVAAAALIYSVIQSNKKPSPVEGQFAIKQLGGDPGMFEDNAFTASKFGNIGFLDQGTKQFSGEAGQVLNKSVSGLLDLFAKRFTDEQIAQTKTNLQALQFPHFEGTFTTEDFLSKYGDKILKQVATTAFNVLDPALGKVIAGFDGTGESLTKFIGSLLIFSDLAKKLPDDVAASLEGAIGNTQEGLEKVTEFALAFLRIQDVFNGSLIEDALKAFDKANQSYATTVVQMGDNLVDLAQKFTDGTATATDLANATEQYYQAQVQLLAQLEQVKVSISTMFQNTIRDLTLQTLDNAGKGNFLNDEVARLQEQLAASSDPKQIQELANRINQDIAQLFGLLTPEEQRAQLGTFTDNIAQLNTDVVARIQEVETAAETGAQGVLTQIQTALQAAIEKMTANALSDADTAAVNAEAAQTQLDAAQTPITIIVDDTRVTAQETNG